MANRFEFAGSEIARLIERIARDNKSGSAEILRTAVETFLVAERTGSQPSQSDPESFRKILVDSTLSLVRAQPEMAPIGHLCTRVLEAMHPDLAPRETARRAADAARDYLQEVRRALEAAASNAARLITDGSTVMTHSHSSTVLAAIERARQGGRSFEVVATESRPMLEGRQLADALARLGIKVSLIVDSAAAMALEQVTFVLVGSDRLTPAFLANKVGTSLIALAARERSVPVYAVSDTSKFTSLTLRLDEEKPAQEVWERAPNGVQILNYYFEPVQLGLFNGFITENGLIGADEARRQAESQHFHDLVNRTLMSISEQKKPKSPK